MTRIKEVKVPNYPRLYRVYEINAAGDFKPRDIFRVRQRLRTEKGWTTRTHTFTVFDEAKKFARSSAQPAAIQKQHTGLTVAEVFESLISFKKDKKRRTEGTLHGYRNRAVHLEFFFPTRVTDVKPSTIDAWVNLIWSPDYLDQQHRTRKDYRKELQLLGMIFDHYRNHFTGDFASQFSSPILPRHRDSVVREDRGDEEVRYLSEDEEVLFLNALSKKPLIRDIALFQLRTGVRVGEAAGLEFSSVDFRNSSIAIRQHLYWERVRGGATILKPGTKGGPDRSFPLTSDCLEMLRRRRETSFGSRVFATETGDWVPYRTFQYEYDRAFRSVGLELRGTHTLRHTFAVRFLAQTKDIYALQRVLGHADLKVTQRYARYVNEEVNRAFEKFRGGQAARILPLVPQAVPSSGTV